MTATLTVTYDATNSRVKLVVAGLNAATNHTQILRWQNGEPQTLPRADYVQGSNAGAVTTFTLYDYAFAEGVANAYQAYSFNSSNTQLDAPAGNVTVTPSNSGVVWLKSVYRPYLNRAVMISEYGDATLNARGGLLQILGQNNPIAVSDVRQARAWPVTFVAANDAERLVLEQFLAFGDILFLQTPGGQDVIDSGYFYAGNAKVSRVGEKKSPYRYVNVDLQAVNQPYWQIQGYTATWAGIVSAFATWTAVEAAFASWNAVNAYIASPTDEIQT